jgi:uncharacterized membrane protein YphA (DoxX/SURF4 family)
MNSNTLQTHRPYSRGALGLNPMTLNVIRLLVGTLFVITGVSNIFFIHRFRETIQQITSISDPLSSSLCLFIILVDIICGAGLLLDKFVCLCTLFLGILTACILYLLAFAVVAQEVFISNCFSFLPLSLSNSSEFILNFLLLDVLAILYSHGLQNKKI